MLSPNGGEIFDAGDEITVSFEYVGPDYGDWVDVYLSLDNGASWMFVDDHYLNMGHNEFNVNSDWDLPTSTTCLLAVYVSD